MLIHHLKRAAAGMAGLIGAFGIFCIFYTLAHMRSWEWPELSPIVGVRGAVFAIVLIVGLIAFTWHCLWHAIAPPYFVRRRLWFKVLMAVWALALVWTAEWSYIEDPPTVAVRDHFIGAADEQQAAFNALKRYRDNGSIAAIESMLPHVDERSLAIMFARVAVNRPSVFDHVSIGSIIAKYAKKYGVSPVLLLDWNYIDSIYGKSPSGPVPFCAEMNVQLFRHLVQVHLPPWLIESRFRRAMVDGPWLTAIAGQRLGTKLRYGAQKATYDIAITPYMTNVMSDLLLVLQEYPAEFQDLLGPGASRDPLARSFLVLRGHALLKPYDQPYSQSPRDAAYYDRYRGDLISFARAAVYRLSSDFDFATKVQALVARYYMDQYAQRLGPDRWAALPERQQTALLAMLRDVYTPNIGHLSYNLYIVPEFNAAPIAYLGAEAAKDYDSLRIPDKTWVPPHPERFWGATTKMLRVLSEVWRVTSGAPLPRVHPTDTIDDDLKVLVRNHEH